MRACQTPFVLRLPLDRHSSELECDEEKFGFDQGKAELQDIISLANRSTHGAEELSHKGAKTEWWEARNTLDARLKDLLNNIQTIWLGGFKGILSQEHQDPDLLSRFQQSLQNILDKHLPSRQKSGKGHQSSRVTLDSRVLELFVGLGPPSECNDVDEPLMDLLYFVVDILQFSGERNAYDEVDFDSITIETIDALRQYHQAIQDKNHSGPKQHTILILDKNLHCFPWESLPCLDGHAVSRLPSLGCLRDRILQQRKQREQCHTPPVVENNYQVSREGGSWVLNPAGDLTATQDRFEEPLQGLPGWESIIRREPTEAEMKSCLEDHDLFLYFGHGSGGQYIRSRTIKRLENCAVALLMGCSSGALTEAGEFEPYGTPMSYIQAGCPALLATLWDVTDKDIDRFSYRVLEKWGLFERPQPQTSPVKKSAKQKGKSRARAFEATTNTEKDRMSLEQAVAESRDSCNLRFLNGAAPVVYGVPVYLA
ncbi:separase, partial [Lecanoromycetidae sp. Uapishka_2]